MMNPKGVIFYQWVIIVTRPRNGYETVGDTKVVSIDSLNNLRSQIRSTASQTKQHVYCKHGFGLHTRGSVVCMFR